MNERKVYKCVLCGREFKEDPNLVEDEHPICLKCEIHKGES